jgi:tetratricopeptide (TPR) repeat protein
LRRGYIHQLAGRHEKATFHFDAALAHYRECGDVHGELLSLDLLADGLLAQKQIDWSIAAFKEAMVICHKLNDIDARAEVTYRLGHACLAANDFNTAMECFDMLVPPF